MFGSDCKNDVQNGKPFLTWTDAAEKGGCVKENLVLRAEEWFADNWKKMDEPLSSSRQEVGPLAAAEACYTAAPVRIQRC